MAELTEQEKNELFEIRDLIKNGKRFDQLELATGPMNKMWVPVRDETGETRRLNIREAVDSAGNAIAGRIWDLTQSTPRASGVYGHPDAIINMDRYFGLGRRLWKNDRTNRKLDYRDSTKYDDGSPAILDGAEGHCIFSFDRLYLTIWTERNFLIKALSKAPIPGKGSVLIYEGGHSWFSGATYDRGTGQLCAYITDEVNCRGGHGLAISPDNCEAPEGSPQQTMLYMPRTSLTASEFSTYARRLSEGWESGWNVHRIVIETMMEIYFGTHNIREEFNPIPDENGLPQGGLGAGCTGWSDTLWSSYNSLRPVIPTNFAVDYGNYTGIVPFDLLDKNGEVVLSVEIPMFFGLINPCYGHTWSWINGMLVNIEDEKAEVYVSANLYDNYDPTILDDKIKAAEIPRSSGFIKRRSYNLLCGMPTELNGSTSTYYCANFWNSSTNGIRIRLAGGRFGYPTMAGLGATSLSTSITTGTYSSSPLCVSKGNQTPFPIDE